jgi:hypothetical protein
VIERDAIGIAHGRNISCQQCGRTNRAPGYSFRSADHARWSGRAHCHVRCGQAAELGLLVAPKGCIVAPRGERRGSTSGIANSLRYSLRHDPPRSYFATPRNSRAPAARYR